MAVYSIKKKALRKFLEKIMKSHELYAPVKTDLVRFEKIDDVKSVYLEQNSFIPVKEQFFRKNEVIFSYDGSKITTKLPKPNKRVFFGIRRL